MFSILAGMCNAIWWMVDIETKNVIWIWMEGRKERIGRGRRGEGRRGRKRGGWMGWDGRKKRRQRTDRKENKDKRKGRRKRAKATDRQTKRGEAEISLGKVVRISIDYGIDTSTRVRYTLTYYYVCVYRCTMHHARMVWSVCLSVLSVLSLFETTATTTRNEAK